MRIFHVATDDDWQQARVSGSYTTSTYGVTLEQEGFIHASRRDQVQPVLERFYGEAPAPLVLLEIETDLLDVPWREEDVAGETFPHIYGPLDVRAVVASDPVDARG